MKRSASFLVVLMFSVVVPVLLANFSSAKAGENCQDKLVGKAFDCDVNSPEGTGNGCIEFETGGISMDFDLLAGGDHYGCACDVTGSFKSPSYDGSSSSFECFSTAAGFLFNGKVKSKKLEGQSINEAGDPAVYNCTEMSSSCP
jgi:hypothetical protein